MANGFRFGERYFVLLENGVQVQLAQLVQVAWVLLIPLGVMGLFLLYKLGCLLQLVLELGTIARYELYPILQNAHRITDRVDVLSSKVTSGVEAVERTAAKAKPAWKKGSETFTVGRYKVKAAAGTLFTGLVGLLKKRLP
jgi:hypothetical protein